MFTFCDWQGGGVSVFSFTITFNGGAVHDNSASGDGGIYLTSGALCQIVGIEPPSSIFYNNVPDNYNSAASFTHLAAPSPPPPLPPPPYPPPPAHPSDVYSNATLAAAVEWLLSFDAAGLIARLHLSAGHYVLAATVDLGKSLASAIYVTSTSDATVTTSSAACVFTTGSTTLLHVEGITFYSSLCLYGGHATVRNAAFYNIDTWSSSALIVRNEAAVEVSHTAFIGNQVYSSGGAITVEGGRLVLFDCRILENAAGVNGGAIMVNGGQLEAFVTLIERNHAAQDGGALMVASGSVLLANETLLLSNTASGKPSSVFIGSGSVTYQLPAPLGRWVLTDGRGAKSALSQGATSSDFPYPCSPGIVGSTFDVSAQSGPQCSGLCPPGDFCPANTSQPRLCPMGHFCAEASPAASPCTVGTWSNVTGLKAESECNNCPAGHACALASAMPTACLPGSFGAQPKQVTCELCPGGKYTSTSGNTACDECTRGYLCVEGSSAPQPCPGGTHANASLAYLSSLAECLECPAGTSCSVGSSQPTACLPGSFGAQPKQATCELCPGGKYTSTSGNTACDECTAGSFCPNGTANPMACPAGTYGNRSGLDSASKCTTTPAGYYSAAGSSKPQQCGGSSLYCPGGRGKPLPVSVVHGETYTNETLNPLLRPNDDATRTSFRSCRAGSYCESGQAIDCPLGYWCANGVQHACAAGRLANRTKQASSRCQGPCPEGYFCTNASTAPEVCPDGTVGDVTGLGTATECSPCPAGYWCNSGRKFPCDFGFYSVNSEPSTLSKDLSTCRRCPLHSTTELNARFTVRSCVCETSYYLAGKDCLPCPTGALCTQPGITLRSLPVDATYWKPGYLSNVTKPCPRASTCASGTVSDSHYNHTSASTCAPGRGVAGVYCLLCAQAGYYFDDDAERCKPCSEEVSRVLLFLVGVLVIVSAIAAAVHYRVGARLGCLATWHRLAIAAHRVSLVTKLKICISYYQILTQLDRVYAIVYPPEYARLIGFLDSVFFRVFFGWIPGVAAACTGLNLAHELILICVAPCVVVLVATTVIVVRQLPLASALVWFLVISFLCFPFVASRGFRALAPCDCFEYVDGGAACFLRDAYSVTCVLDTSTGTYSAPLNVRAAAWLAISIYAIAIPCAYAGLLFHARHSLLEQAPQTALSRRLHFLTKDYQPRVFYWELAEVMRKIVITGFLALVKPGSLLQLYLGVAVALCILILQLYATPYATASDNFLSFVSASAMVFTLLASLGIQLTELTPDLSALGLALTGLGGHPLPLIVAVLIVAGLCVLLVVCVMFVQELRASGRLPFAHTVKEGKVAQPRFLADGKYHAFVSHQWSHGQDQARAISLTMSDAQRLMSGHV